MRSDSSTFWSPKVIDSTFGTGALGERWALEFFGLQHNGMARQKFKAMWARLVSESSQNHLSAASMPFTISLRYDQRLQVLKSSSIHI